MFNPQIPSDMNTANIISANSADLIRASFMVAKTKGTINPIVLGAKLAMIAELKKRFAKGEVVEFDFIKKSTGEIRHATGILPNNAFIASRINGRGVPNSIYGNITYFDLDRNDFRVFSVETLVRVY